MPDALQVSVVSAPAALADQAADQLVARFVVGEPLPQRKAYPDQAKARAFWRLSDRAGHTYAAGLDAVGNSVLPSHEREEGSDYKRRKAISKVRRYVRSIIDRYNDHVTRQEAKRPEGEATYQNLTADADGTGTPLATVMRRALRRAQIEGVTYLLADTNKSAETKYASRAQEIAAGIRPLILRIGADHVPWWRDWRGEMVEALVLLDDAQGVLFGLYVTDKIRQRIDFKSEGGQLIVTAVGTEQPHTFKGCPLVRLMPQFGDDDEVGEDSQGAPIAESQKRVFHLDSLMMEEIESCTFTTLMITGISAEQLGKVTLGNNRILCVPQVAARLDKIGADPVHVKTVRDTMADEIADLYRIAGLSPGNPLETGAPESGVAKAFAFNEVEAKLSALGDAAERAENAVVMRAMAGVGEPYPGDANWPESFESPDLGSELDFCIRTLSSPLPDLIKQEQMRRYVAQAYKLDDKLAAQVKAQIDAYATPPATAMPAETSTLTIQDEGA